MQLEAGGIHRVIAFPMTSGDPSGPERSSRVGHARDRNARDPITPRSPVGLSLRWPPGAWAECCFGDKGGVRVVRRVAFSRSRAKLGASRRRATASAVSPDAGASRAGGRVCPTAVAVVPMARALAEVSSQPTVEPRRPRRRPDWPTRGGASRRGPRTVGRPPGRAPAESRVSTFPTARPGCARAAA